MTAQASSRRQESILLAQVSLILVLGALLLAWNTAQPYWAAARYPLLLCVGAWVLHGFFRWIGYKAAPILLPLTVSLNGFGVLVLQSVEPALAARHAVFGVVGLFLWAVLAYFDIWRSLRRIRYVSGISAFLLLVVTAVFGERVGGARAWLSLGPVQFQPSEPGKILLILFLAGVLADLLESSLRDATDSQQGAVGQALTKTHGKSVSESKGRLLGYLGPAVSVWTVSMLTLVAQRDLGAALLFSGILVILLVAGLRSWWYLVWSLVAGAAGGVLAVRLFEHVRTRLDVWLNPWQDPAGAGYQAIQAMFGLAAGGVTGVGPGLGMASVIPAAPTDFILVGTGEEWGLAGVFWVLACFLLLLWHGMAVALSVESAYGKLLAVGFTGMLWLQAAMVGGGITRLVPLTGITTPFLSYGGSSLLTNYTVIGLLANLSHAACSTGRLAPKGGKLAIPSSVVLTLSKLMTGGLVAVLLAFAYWQVLCADQLNLKQSNPRLAAQRLQIRRGGVYDRRGEVIARSVKQGSRFVRTYTKLCSLGPTIGYYSIKYGLSGLEAALNKELSGQTEKETFAGWWKSEVLGELPRGRDVFTTIDLNLQKVAQFALGKQRGAVVAVVPQTGEILALATSPGFLPQNVDEQWQDLVSDEGSPFLNRPVQGLYPPGSAFKILVLAAALETGVIEFGSTFKDRGAVWVEGHEIQNFDGRSYGELDLYTALAVSSNVAFVQIGQRLGEQRFRQMVERFGIGRELPLRLPHKVGRLARDQMSATELAEESIGQGKLLVTPLEMALITATIANGGGLPAPILVKAIKDSKGNLVYFQRPRLVGHPVSRQVAAFVRDAMIEVVNRGTGQRAAIPGIAVAGKTGTAENPHGRPHGWFVGFAPAYQPKVAVAVVVENGGSGGTVAAPIARQVLEAALRSL